MEAQKNLRPVLMLFLLSAVRTFDENKVGNTRVQKLLFLIQKESSQTIEKGFTFKPDKYGPAAEEFFDVIYLLSDRGFVSFELDENQNIRNCKLTAEGETKVNELKQKYPEISEAVQEIVKEYANLDLNLLLLYVYTRYPEYTLRSLIKDEITQIAKYYFSTARRRAQEAGFTESELKLYGV